MSHEKIAPALTAEEWSRKHKWIQAFDSWGDDETQRITGVGEIRSGPDYLTVTSHQHSLHAVFSAPTDRHALAALCLYGQRFGFTQEDVSGLRMTAALLVGSGWGSASLRSLAARIAALLPPGDELRESRSDSVAPTKEEP